MARYSVVSWGCGDPAVRNHSVVETLEEAEEEARKQTQHLSPGDCSTVYEIFAQVRESKPHELLVVNETDWFEYSFYTVFAWVGSGGSDSLLESFDDEHVDKFTSIIDHCCRTKNTECELFFLITRPKVTYRNPPMERVEV